MSLALATKQKASDRMIRTKAAGPALVGMTLLALSVSTRQAAADHISHPTAVFSGLDKITGRIISFEVATNETVQFGSLEITERACYTRPPTEAPQTITFAQVDEIDAKKKYKRIFSGWMFASSPGLHGIEHPVYDIWLTDCKGGTTIQKSPVEASAAAEPPPNAELPIKPDKKRRRAEERAARRKHADQTSNPDVASDKPRGDARRAPPSRSFFPDAAGDSDTGGLY